MQDDAHDGGQVRGKVGDDPPQGLDAASRRADYDEISLQQTGPTGFYVHPLTAYPSAPARTRAARGDQAIVLLSDLPARPGCDFRQLSLGSVAGEAFGWSAAVTVDREAHVASTSASTHGSDLQGKSVSPLLEISNAMVRLYKEAFGRGPTKARAQFAGADTLLVVLEDTMTAGERSLVALGDDARLRDTRMFVRYALEDRFRAIVEQALGRRTLAFVSGVDTRYDVCVEVFTLEPLAGADGSRLNGRPGSPVWSRFDETGPA